MFLVYRCRASCACYGCAIGGLWVPLLDVTAWRSPSPFTRSNHSNVVYNFVCAPAALCKNCIHCWIRNGSSGCLLRNSFISEWDQIPVWILKGGIFWRTLFWVGVNQKMQYFLTPQSGSRDTITSLCKNPDCLKKMHHLRNKIWVASDFGLIRMRSI